MTHEEAIKELEKIAQFKTEAVSVPVYMGIKALEKEIPKPLRAIGITTTYYVCPFCQKPITNEDFERKYPVHECGQFILWVEDGCKDGVCEIDWSDEE